MSASDLERVEGSGNVFRDFRDPQADLRQAKAIIAARIIAVLGVCAAGVHGTPAVCVVTLGSGRRPPIDEQVISRPTGGMEPKNRPYTTPSRDS